MPIPSVPTPFGSSLSQEEADRVICSKEFDDFETQLAQTSQIRDQVFKCTHAVNASTSVALQLAHRGDIEQCKEILFEIQNKLDACISSLPPKSEDIRPILSGCTERMLTIMAFIHFIETGRVISKQDISLPVTRDEYLSGVLSFLNELPRYAVGRATKRDVVSILVARDLVEAANAQFMQFDFRNSPLRRKYDTLKYVLKRLQDMLYELSLTNFEEAKCLYEGTHVPADPATIVNIEEFDELRKEMEKYDEVRDKIIKRCRDVTKQAKNAIYSLHRGDFKRAKIQISESEAAAKEMLPHIVEYPTLRSGSFSGGVEEYVEAVTFLHFLENHTILPMNQMPLVEMPEYLGGLSDLTGEIGRYAVAQATSRNKNEVERSHSLMEIINGKVLRLPLQGQLAKKYDSIKTNLKKLEDILYELSLVGATPLTSISHMDNDVPVAGDNESNDG